MITYYSATALTDILHAAIRQTPEGESFTLQFSWWDWRGDGVEKAMLMLEEIARSDGLSLRFDLPNRHTLQVTRLARLAVTAA